MIPTQEEQDKKLEEIINEYNFTTVTTSDGDLKIIHIKPLNHVMKQYAKWYAEQVVKEVTISAVSDVYSEEDIPDYVQGDYRIDTNSCTCYYVDTQEMLNRLNNKEQ